MVSFAVPGGLESVTGSVPASTCWRAPLQRSKLCSLSRIPRETSLTTAAFVCPTSTSSRQTHHLEGCFIYPADARFRPWLAGPARRARKGLHGCASSSLIPSPLGDSVRGLGASTGFSAVSDALLPYLGWLIVLLSWWAQLSYHWNLYNTHSTGHDIWATLTGPNIESRKRWADIFTKSKKDVITAVQSLRNALMIATANASMSVALLSLCLGPLLDAFIRGSFPVIPEMLPFVLPSLLGVVKMGVLTALLIMQFVCFTKCCYYWVHMTFMLPVVEPDVNALITATGLVDVAIHAQAFWWWGYRALYMTIPAVVWVVVGTLPFALTSGALVTIMSKLDRPLRKNKPLEYYL